jgi:pimeloyl-ACP methyl ester carboxylesterase
MMPALARVECGLTRAMREVAMDIRPRSVALVCVIVLVLTTALGAVGAAAVSSAPQITWSPCYRDIGLGAFECGSLAVPLVYSGNHDGQDQAQGDNDGGPQISIAVVRLPASDPQHRIGSMFINPGGPGGSGVDFALFARFLFSADVLARFDIVGFDPRGIFRSTQLRCFNSPLEWGPYFTPFAFPSNDEEERIWIKADRFLDSACTARGGAIRDHMSTANVARDLDRLRAAVGDKQLTYAGYSYGTYLGVTYANLFPSRVRALIVDGVLDPIAWATGVGREGQTIPFSTRLHSEQGAQATLQEFFRLCDGGAGCAFAPHSADRYAELGERLKEAPIRVVDPATGTVLFEFNYSLLIANSLSAMYNSSSWPFFAQFLAFLEAQAGADELRASLAAFQSSLGIGPKLADPDYNNQLEGLPGVACSDTDNPSSYSAWSRQGALADKRFGYFGRIWTWLTSICAEWPGTDRDRYIGPFTRSTANPVLVIGNNFDPATRYQGAVTVSGLLPRSRLLTVHGWGHTSILLSECANAAVTSYLVNLTLPARGTVCEQDAVPFAAAPLSVQRAASANPGARAALIPEALVRAMR